MESRCLLHRALMPAGDARSGPRRTRRTPRAGPARARCGALGQVLADVVGADRQLAVPAVDEHGEPHRARAGRGRSARRGRPGRCARRRARRRPARRPCRRRRPAASRCGRRPRVGLLAQVVAVHRDVEGRRAGTSAPSTSAIRSASAAGEVDAAGRDAEQDEVRRGPCCARGSRGRCGSGPGRCHGRRGRCGRRVEGMAPGGTDACRRAPQTGPPSPPHGTAR